MAYTKPRFLIANYATADTITASGQGAGTIAQAKKTGTGTSLLTPAGVYTGAANLLYTVQCDLAGTVDSGATFRWRTSATAVGSWEATGVAATTTPSTLSNGVQVLFSAGTLVLSDKFQFYAYAETGPGNLFVNNRDKYYQTADLPATIVSNGSFTSATTGWTAAATCTIASVAGGYSGNCCQLTMVSGTYQYFYQNLTTVAGTTYYIRAYVKSGTSGDEACRLNILDVGTSTTIKNLNTTSSASWVSSGFTSTFTALGTSTRISLYKFTSSAGTMLFDEVYCVACPSLTVNIGSAQLVTAFLLGDHNLSATAQVILEANSSASWVPPAYTSTLSTITDPLYVYLSQTYQYWRAVLIDPENADGYLRIGKLYLGTYTELAGSSAVIPWNSEYTIESIEIENESDAGKETGYVYSERKVFDTRFKYLDATDLATLKTVFEATRDLTTGQKISIWLHYWTDDSAYFHLCRRISKEFRIVWKKYDLHEVVLAWREEVITRSL